MCKFRRPVILRASCIVSCTRGVDLVGFPQSRLPRFTARQRLATPREDLGPGSTDSVDFCVWLLLDVGGCGEEERMKHQRSRRSRQQSSITDAARQVAPQVQRGNPHRNAIGPSQSRFLLRSFFDSFSVRRHLTMPATAHQT